MVWTTGWSDVGGDFALIVNPTSSNLRLVHVNAYQIPDEKDFDASKLSEWMRMRVIDVVKADNEGSTTPPRISPLDFLYDARSKSIIVVQSDGFVFERLGNSNNCGCGWRKLATISTVKDEDHFDFSFALTTLKRGRFLAVAGRTELSVFDLDNDGQRVEQSGRHDNVESNAGRLRFCRGRMPFSLVIQSGDGISRVAIASVSKLTEDITKHGFSKTLKEVDQLINGEGVDKKSLTSDLVQLTTMTRPNAFVRGVMPELEILVESLTEWREKSCSYANRDDEYGGHPIPMSDVLVAEIYQLAHDGRLRDEKRRDVLHQLDFLSHSEPHEVLDSLTSLVYSHDGDPSVEKDVFFSTLSTSPSSESSPTVTVSTSAAADPLHTSFFELFVALFLLHRVDDFKSMMKDLVYRFFHDESNPEWVEASRLLEGLRQRLESEGKSHATRSLDGFLREVKGKAEAGEIGKRGPVKHMAHTIETLTSLVRNADWNGCVAHLAGLKAAMDASSYATLFGSIFEEVNHQSGEIPVRFLKDLMRFMPKNYDLEHVLTLIEKADNRSCSNHIRCENLDCVHVSVGNLR